MSASTLDRDEPPRMAAAPPLHLRVFLSSPGDVADERNLARRVLKDELPVDPFLRGRVTLDPVSWDDPHARTPMLANLTPQEAVNRGLAMPSACDIVVVVLWSRMGTPLPEEYRKPNGEPYLSGTEWEYEDALTSGREPKPDVLVYRRTEDPPVKLNDPKLEEKREQWARVERFFGRFKSPDGSLRGGYETYATPSEFAERLKGDLRALLRSKLDALPTQPQPAEAPGSTEPPWQGSPYPGLRAFTFEEAPIFFGRGREVDQLVARLREPAQRFLCVVGASGTGKSSLVRAGLLPRVLAGSIDGGERWRVLTFTPGATGDDPFLALAVELWASLPAAGPEPPREIARALGAEPGRVSDYAARALADEADGARLVLFADQLEELFTLAAEHRRAGFVDLLARAVADERLRVLTTLRADYFAQATASPTLASLLQGGIFPLAPPGPAALLDMVRRPAECAGLELDEGLADAILADTGSASGALPLMGFALAELHRRSQPARRLTCQAYEQMGRLKGAIAARAEEVVGKLPVEAQTALPRVFQALVHVDATGTATRRRADRADLASDEAIAQLLDRLTESAARLLQGGEREGRPTVEVAHEALFEGWPQLSEWLDRNRARLQRVQRLLLGLAAREPEDRVHAVQMLGEIGPAAVAAVPALAAALKDDDRDVRARAARALGAIGPAAAKAIPALAAALKDEDWDIRVRAAHALGAIGPAAAAAVPALAAALKHKDRNLRAGAAEALGRIGPMAAKAVLALAAALKDEDWDVRATVISALAEIGPAAVPALAAALKDEDWDVRVRTAYALGKLGPAAVPALAVALKDEDPDVRARAAEILRRIKGS